MTKHSEAYRARRKRMRDARKFRARLELFRLRADSCKSGRKRRVQHE